MPGIFLLENGFDLYMWLGRQVNPALLSTLFSLPSLEGVDMGGVSLRGENSDFSSRVVAVIEALREVCRHTVALFPHFIFHLITPNLPISI